MLNLSSGTKDTNTHPLVVSFLENESSGRDFDSGEVMGPVFSTHFLGEGSKPFLETSLSLW